MLFFRARAILLTETVAEQASTDSKNANSDYFGIPDTVKKLVAGVGRVNRDAFFDKFDVGVPKDKTEKGNEEVLILYNHDNSLPSKGVSQTLSPEDATEHCHSMKLVFTEPKKKNECLAVVGQWESYHVYKYMRLPPGKDKKVQTDAKHPLRYVSRLHGEKGLQQQIPYPQNVKSYDETLVTYLSSLDKVLEELKPIAQKAARDDTIIVMVCNFGQSELLMNFACSCRARGLDLSQVLVFATDMETKELAEGLGLLAFYDQTVRDCEILLSVWLQICLLIHLCFLYSELCGHARKSGAFLCRRGLFGNDDGQGVLRAHD